MTIARFRRMNAASEKASAHRPKSAADVVRRVVDIVAVIFLLVVLCPLLLLIAIMVRLDSTGPVIFKQIRLGLGRRQFVMYKFRTMRLGEPDTKHREMIRKELRGEAEAVDGSYKLSADARITPIGRLLRATSFDELPQLINVLRGHMSLVGPRPCLDWEADMFPEEYQARFHVRPGLTGLWQVSGRSTLDTLDMLRLDLRYVQTRTLWKDMCILLATVPALLRNGGAR